MTQDILIIAEHKNGIPLPVTFEIFTFAEQIRKHHRGDIVYMVPEGSESNVSQEIAERTGVDIITLPLGQPGPLTGEACLLGLTEVLSNRSFAYVCIPHTALGIDYAFRLAMRLEASCISGVNGIDFRNDRIQFQRPIFGGKLNEQIRPHRSMTVLTVLQGQFSIPAFSANSPGHQIVAATKPVSPKIMHIERLAGNEKAEGLAEARVVVAAGNGIGKKEHLALVKQLADLFPKSAVAGSRPVCDRGWLPYNRQVGVTGVQVSPELYIACGISGAYQHIAGMQASGLIVAINTDPNAAIFNVSDIGVVADLTEFIPAFLSAFGSTEEA